MAEMISSSNISEDPKKPVVFSFQGAFGPPTLGHYTAMKLFAIKILQDPDYINASNIVMMFMPTALGSAKPHLLPTQNSRIDVLNKFCELLDHEFSGTPIHFIASDIEYELCRGSNKSTATIRTIEKLRSDFPDYRIVLGMGLDNMFQLPYWGNIKDYTVSVEKIYVASRALTELDMAKTRKFLNPGRIVPVNFEIIVPSWANLEQVREGFGISGNTHADLTDALKEAAPENGGPYPYYIPLPEIVMVGEGGEIPATSSSMMRYFIYKYLEEPNEEIKEKIRNLMWGKKRTSETEELLQKTINVYQNYFTNNNISYPTNNELESDYDEIIFTGGKKMRKKQGKKSCKKNKKRTYRKQTKKRMRKRYKHSKK
jgi:nicotinic acid mononucleotide adenylyltransferase